MLTNAQVPGPYVLVGHSLGAWIVRLYASQYPDEVAGVVFLDGSSPGQLERWVAALPTASPGDANCLVLLRNDLAGWGESDTIENWNFAASEEQARAVTSLGDIPVMVLTAGYVGQSCPASDQIFHDTWLTLHQEMAALSTNGIQATVPGASHFMWFEEADRVVSWIKQMVQSLQP